MSDLAQRARHGDAAERQAIAAGPATPPELLTWLAADPAADVRRAVAANHATPPRAGLLLATDADAAVRGALARRISALAPGLGADSQDRLARLTGAVLLQLAQDTAEEIRAIIAEGVAGLPNAPREVVLRLARDGARAVAGPVLRLSPLLEEADLAALIAAPPAGFTRERIAARADLPESVAERIAASADSAAIATLLGNPSAAIREATLDRLVAGAEAEPQWRAALVRRPSLPPHSLRMLAAMLTDALLDAMAARPDLPGDLAESLRARLSARLDTPAHWEVQQAARRGDQASLAAQLAAATGLSATRLDAALALRSPRVLVALCHRAGWPPAAMADVQRACGIPPDRALAPTAAGSWPLAEEEMRWQMELLEDLPE